jgi:hypothetical protein
VTIGHLDETGRPCTRHPELREDNLLAFAMLGARASSFHHDIASKLQGLMMALDEISELVEMRPDPDIRRAAETAHAALTDLNQLLGGNRALTKPPVRSNAKLGELVVRASERVGVNVRGASPDAAVVVAVPAFTHALTLAIDAAAGVGRNRNIVFEVVASAGCVELLFGMATPAAPNISELLALASWLLARDDAELRCGADKLAIRVPTA